MALTSAQIDKQAKLLADVKAAFNDGVVPVAPLLTALRAEQPNPTLDAAIAAWEKIMPALNANTPAIRAAIDATAAMVPSDPPVATPPLFANDLSSDAIIQRDFWHANVFYNPGPSLPTVNNPSKWIGGMLEVPIILGLNSTPGQGGTGCSWHWWMPAAVMAAQELWAEYDFYIDPDVPIGFNEEGCKLPGLAGAWEQPGQWAAGGAYGWFSARLWHRRPDAAGNCELAAYVYSARSMDAGNSYGEIIPTGKLLKPGVKYKLGQHIKLNSGTGTAWNSDGIFEILLDGAAVFSDTAFKMRGDARATFQDFFVNIFHGGGNAVLAPIHYRIGNVVVDNKPTYRATAPTTTSTPFFADKARFEWAQFPNSSLLVNGPPQNRPDYVEARQTIGGSRPNEWAVAGIGSWSGGGFNPRTGKYYIRFGGHNSTHWNGLLTWDPELAAKGDKHGGWRIPMQPNLYNQADVDDWVVRCGGDVAYDRSFGFPNDINGLWKADNLMPALPTSLHSYAQLEYSDTLGGLLQANPSNFTASTWFWLFKEDGTFAALPGDAARSPAGAMILDPVNDVMLGFTNFANGSTLSVRRFDLKTKTDLPAVPLTVLTIASGFTQPMYWALPLWASTGFGFLAGRWFHYYTPLNPQAPGSGATFRVNIDTWRAEETTWFANSKTQPIPGVGAYSPVTQCAYWMAPDGLWQMSVPTMTLSLVSTTGVAPNMGANDAGNGQFNRIRYYPSRGSLLFINSGVEDVFTMKVDQ